MSDDKDIVDLEVLVDLEQQFYDVGYKDGLEHGKIHGRIEGRQLGREKGFEMWEEVGFYEGFAKFWKALYERDESKDNRISHNAKLLLNLIAQFPKENSTGDESADIDIPKLLNQIRSRYKMICSLVNVKPSLRANQGLASTTEESAPGKKAWNIDSVAKQGEADVNF